MIDPPRWSVPDLERDLALAIGAFRQARLQEPLEQYIAAFDEYRRDVETLLNTTNDLHNLSGAALDVLADRRLLQAFRYLAGPPISADDLKTVAEARSLIASRLVGDAALVGRIIEVVRIAFDRRRFPWVVEQRDPSEAERRAAIMATAALMATQRLSTSRRNEGKELQEGLVEGALLGAGLALVERRTVETFSHAPAAGEFCRESMLGERKADFILRLWDERVMPIECKVSNSAINSVKRLNNDAAAKAEAWRIDFGERQVIPVAVLSGVFKLRNLEDAQNRGLTLFWAHNLSKLTDWIERTRPA